MNTSCQILTKAGPYTDNRRGSLAVERFALEQAEIVITIPPTVNGLGTQHRVNLAGEHLTDLVERLREVADALEACTELEIDTAVVA
jgi:hypothetical protein